MSCDSASDSRSMAESKASCASPGGVDLSIVGSPASYTSTALPTNNGVPLSRRQSTLSQQSSGSSATRALSSISRSSDESKIFSITKERQQGAEPARPSFIRDHQLAFQDPVLYQQVVLPSVSELTFEISSLPDVQHFRAMLAAESQMPQFWRAVTKVAFPGFYWFSGIAHNRTCNPYLEVVGNLPFLSELSLTFHTAGLTHSRYGERDRLKIEETDIEKSKELKVTRVADVVRKYDLSSVFKCTSLRILRLECFDSQIVDHFTGTVDQFSSFRELQYFFIDGFRQYCGREIQVCSKVIPIEWKDEDAM